MNNFNDYKQQNPYQPPTQTAQPVQPPAQPIQPPYQAQPNGFQPQYNQYQPEQGTAPAHGAYYAPPIYYPPVPPKPQKKTKPFNKKDFVFLALFFVCTIVGINFALIKGFHLGFTISYFALFAVATAYLKKKFTAFSVICGALSLVGAVSLAFFDSTPVSGVMLMLIAFLFTVYCIGISGCFKNGVNNFKMLLDTLLETCAQPVADLGLVARSAKNGAGASKNVLGALIGVVVAIPVLVVVIPLLCSSDAAFQNLFKNLLENIGAYIGQIIFAVVITPFLFSYMFGKRNGSTLSTRVDGKKTRIFPISACISFLSVISVVYIVFIFSQLAYFFSAFKGILPDGYDLTASEYARKGFYEMFAVCVINILLVGLIFAFVKRKNIVLKILSAFVSLFSVLLIVIAMQKMRLNVATYGLSRNRLFVCVFLIMALVVIAFLIAHIFMPKLKYMQSVIVACSVIFIAFSFCDVDACVARYNINAYQNGQIETLDFDTLDDLSSSAIPYIADLADNAKDKETTKKASNCIAQWSVNNSNSDWFKVSGGKLVRNKSIDFRDSTLSRQRARDSVVNMKNQKLTANIYSFINDENCDYWNYNSEDDSYDVDRDGNGFYAYYEYNAKSGLYEIDDDYYYDDEAAQFEDNLDSSFGQSWL